MVHAHLKWHANERYEVALLNCSRDPVSHNNAIDVPHAAMANVRKADVLPPSMIAIQLSHVIQSGLDWSDRVGETRMLRRACWTGRCDGEGSEIVTGDVAWPIVCASDELRAFS